MNLPGLFRRLLVLVVAVTFAAPAASRSDEHHWAFLPLRNPKPPALADATGAGPIDAFVSARLSQHGLRMSPVADRRTLLRRVTMDLLGIPPTEEELRSFLADESPLAYAAVVDRLLQSPHFGERWGRHWLDGAAYADVIGTDNDAAIIRPLENRWLYRDYVVRSLNEDKPFDVFLLEQIAGDELVDWRNAEKYTPEIQERLIATGYLRMSPDDTFENELNLPPARHGVLERTIEILSNNLMGLSLGCAKCHDHKYEPITQRDYYALKAVFQPAFNPDLWQQPVNRQLPGISSVEKKRIEAHNADLDRQIQETQASLAKLRQPYEIQLRNEKLANIPDVIREDTRQAIETPAEQRTEIQKYLASKFEPLVTVQPAEIPARYSDEDAAKSLDLESSAKQLAAQRQAWAHWQVICDVGPPTPTLVLERGDVQSPGEEVHPAMFAVLSSGNAAFAATAKSRDAASSGRRLALATLLTDTSSATGALVLRVRVNRIWQHFFGKGFVETPDNFGVTGSAATHPELLEWLARDFVENGLRLKPLVRQILLSATYRQSSVSSNLEAERLDPDNRLLWRQRLRRLDSDSIRDSLLAVSGELDQRLGGPPLDVEPQPDGSFLVKEKGLAANVSPHRRTLYLLARRNYHPTILSVFDQPNFVGHCAVRQTSAVVLQPLTMLNDRFVLDRAAALARQTPTAGNSEPAEVISTVFERILGRPPSTSELEACKQSLRNEIDWRQNAAKTSPAEATAQAVESFCHTLLNTNEFLYVP